MFSANGKLQSSCGLTLFKRSYPGARRVDRHPVPYFTGCLLAKFFLALFVDKKMLPDMRCTFKITAFVIVMFSCFTSRANPGPCDDAIRYLEATTTLVKKLPPYPGTEGKADSVLAIFKQTEPASERKLHQAILFAEKKRKSDPSFLQCLVENAHLTDSNYNNWSQFLAGHYVKLTFRSPEFVRGFGLHLDVSQGGADLGTASESYAVAGRALLSYTFVPKSAPTNAGGHVRLLGGVSTYYAFRELETFANLRGEFRIRDIGNDLTSFGNVKLIADLNHNNDYTIIGGGAGVELYNFGIQLLYQRETQIGGSYLLFGIFYRFHFTKP
jgi:hypothetical protein